MTNLFNTPTETCQALIQILEKLDAPELLTVARLLSQRFANPQAFVTLVGETSTGKTTIVNGLLSERLLPTAASPTTGTVTQVVCMESGGTKFFAINRDGTQEELEIGQFQELCVRPDSELLRLQLRAQPTKPSFAGFNIFDTPGYNALLAEHEEILRNFLPESDVVVFVAGYRTGFGQTDQDLFEVVQSALGGDKDIPYLLVINRVPEGIGMSDKRVQEILFNAADSLHRQPETILVRSAPLDPQGELSSQPQVDACWQAVHAAVSNPKHESQVRRKLVLLLEALIEACRALVERRLLALQLSREELEEVEAQIFELKQTLGLSLAAVDACETRLLNRLHPALDRASESVIRGLNREVDESNKWSGADDCLTWIQGHALNAQIRANIKGIEQILTEELERLDQELEDLANTAIQRIERQVRINSGSGAALMLNLSQNLLREAGGSLIAGALRNLGGVGGIAAGTGNLVKMVVSRAGKLVGKRFSREIFDSIGRAFTKRAVKAASLGLAVAIEGIFFLIEANLWQGQLKKKILEVIGNWKRDVGNELFDKQVPSITEANRNGVRDLYTSILAEPLKWREARLAEQGSTQTNLKLHLAAIEQLKYAISAFKEN